MGGEQGRPASRPVLRAPQSHLLFNLLCASPYSWHRCPPLVHLCPLATLPPRQPARRVQGAALFIYGCAATFKATTRWQWWVEH